MSLRHRAFISRQTVIRPRVTSAKDAADYFVGAPAYPALRKTWLAPRNNSPLCILGLNLVVKTSWKEQPEQACPLGIDRDHRGIDPSKHFRRRKGSDGSLKNVKLFWDQAGIRPGLLATWAGWWPSVASKSRRISAPNTPVDRLVTVVVAADAAVPCYKWLVMVIGHRVLPATSGPRVGLVQFHSEASTNSKEPASVTLQRKC